MIYKNYVPFIFKNKDLKKRNNIINLEIYKAY